MAIIIERTITIKNDQATLDSPLYLYIGDGNITCLFTIKEMKKAATFGSITSTNLITENASYGEAKIYKPNQDHADTTRAEIIDDKLQVVFSFDNIDENTEAGVHKLQIHLYDNESGERNRLTIPPVDIHVLMPIGVESSLINEAIVGYSLLDARTEDIPTYDEEGNYNKTVWQKGDIITQNKLNKIEEALCDISAADDNFVTNNTLDTALNGINMTLNNKASKIHKHTAADITTGLSRVATTGSYNDLSNKPTIPDTSNFATKSDITNHTHTGYATSGHTHDNYSVTTHTHTGYAASNHKHDNYAADNHTHDNYADKAQIPTKVGALENDKGYITNTEANGRYATKDYVIEYVDQAIGSNPGEGGDPGTSTPGNANIDDESISKYTVYSSSKVYDLVTQLSAVDTQVNDDLVDIDNRLTYVEKEIADIKDLTPDPGNGESSDYVTEEELSTALAGKSDIGHTHDYAPNNHLHDDRYALKTEIPEIPKVISYFDNDVNYITAETVNEAITPISEAIDNINEELDNDYAKKTDNISTFTNDTGYITSGKDKDGNYYITRIEIVDVLPKDEEPGVLYIVKA